jgi:hypothetical protein
MHLLQLPCQALGIRDRSRESLRLRPPPSVGRIRLSKDRWLRTREMRAMRIRRSYIENSRKKEEGKSDLRSLKGSRKTRAQYAPASHDSFEFNLRNASGLLIIRSRPAF